MRFDRYFDEQRRDAWRGKGGVLHPRCEACERNWHAAHHAYVYERTVLVRPSQLERMEEFATTLLASRKKCRDFASLNYMALLDAMETDDKEECKAAKRRVFFEILSQSPFFRQYMKLPREQGKRLDTVIFDKDGTIVQPLPLFGAWIHELTKAIYHVLVGQSQLEGSDPDPSLWTALGYSPPTEARPYGSFIPSSVVLCGVNEDIKNTMCEWAVARDVAHGIPKRDVQALRSAVSAAWSEPRFTRETVLPIGDVAGLWKTLRERHGVRIAVCTSDDREATIEQLSLLGLKPDTIVCGDDKLSSKPSPEPIWRICHELDTHPSQCIMIGDTVSDVYAGLNAGCAKVAVVRSDGKVPESLAQEADYVWDSLHGVAPCLDSRTPPEPKAPETSIFAMLPAFESLTAFEGFLLIVLSLSIRALLVQA